MLSPSSHRRARDSAQRPWPQTQGPARRPVMDFSWSRAEEEFRQESRDFLKAELPQGWNDTLVLDKESDEYIALAKDFTKRVGAKGWLAAHWPQEYGGLSWSFWQYFIMNEEMAIADAPLIGLNGPKFLGPRSEEHTSELQTRLH